MDDDGFMVDSLKDHPDHLSFGARMLFEEFGSSDDDDESSATDAETSDLAVMGRVVEQWRPRPVEVGLSAARSAAREVRGVHWLALPDELMCLVLAKLPFSSFCRFRSVCKKWNALMVYPDPTLMTVRSSDDTAPLCVMHSLACYNPASHGWHRLPASFQSSFGALGFSGQQAGVEGACSALLVLSSGYGSSTSLWVVNPVNKSERKLPKLNLKGGWRHSLKIRLNEDHSSFQVFQVISYDRDDNSRFRMEIYDSDRDSWRRTPYMRNVGYVCSIIEFEGAIYTLLFESEEQPWVAFILKHWQTSDNADGGGDGNGRRRWLFKKILLPRRIQGGHFFVRHGKLLLGAVLECNVSVQRSRCWRKGRMACVWEMEAVSDSENWKQIICMPEELRDQLVQAAAPHVDACGDYLWISSKDGLNTKVGKQNYGSLYVFSGIMCHIPSNTWWKLPDFRQSPLYRMHHEVYVKEKQANEPDPIAVDSAWGAFHGALCEIFHFHSFLFSPRMDLVV